MEKRVIVLITVSALGFVTIAYTTDTPELNASILMTCAWKVVTVRSLPHTPISSAGTALL